MELVIFISAIIILVIFSKNIGHKQNIAEEKRRKEEEEKRRKEEEEKRRKEEEEGKIKEQDSLNNFEKVKNTILKKFDKDNNGIIDIIEEKGAEDFLKLLNKHQTKIIEIDNNYVQNFVKISTYLNDNKNNITSLFNQLKKFKPLYKSKHLNEEDKDSLFRDAASVIVMHQQGSASSLQRKLKLGYNRAGRIIDQLEAAGIIGPFEGSKARQVLIPDEYAIEQVLEAHIDGQIGVNRIASIDFSINEMKNLSDIIAQQIQTYNLILANALSMIISAIQKDLVSFYRVYEVFDRLNVFDSTWQKTLSNNITLINDNLSNITAILEDINSNLGLIEQNISSGLNEISNNINSSSELIISELKSVNSSIDFNNILTGMNTIQLYNINKNTSSD